MRGYFGIGIYGTKTVENVGILSRSAHNMGAAFLFTIGKRYRQARTDTTKAWKSIPFYEFETFEDMKKIAPKESLIVGVEQAEGCEDLPQMIHPQQAIYVLGAEDFGLPKDILEQCQRVVQIPSTRCLNVGVAGSILIYDRMLKLGLK